MYSNGEWTNSKTESLPMKMGMNILAITQDGQVRQMHLGPGYRWVFGEYPPNGYLSSKSNGSVVAQDIVWWRELPE